MIGEPLLFTCKHVRTLESGKCVCPSYPKGVPSRVPCSRTYDCLLKHDPIPPCPNGMHYEPAPGYVEYCQKYLDALKRKRAGDRHAFNGDIYEIDPEPEDDY